MIDKLREYVDGLFKDAPQTKQTVEIKEEILQNTIDRYNDILSEGKSEQAAYNIAVAGIGDVDMLISSLMAPKSMSGYTREEIEKDRRRNALMLSVSVILYILCIIPPIIFEAKEMLGVVLMFVMIAVATGLIIYRSNTRLRYDKSDETVVEDFKQWNKRRKEDDDLFKAVRSAIWAVTLVLYFVISFVTGAWYITWLIFIIGGAVSNIVRACFDLKE